MADTPEEISDFVALTRQRQAAKTRPRSKLESHREAILAAVAENLPITSIRAVLAEHYRLKVSYSNLRMWIRHQQQASAVEGDQPASPDPTEPLNPPESTDQP